MAGEVLLHACCAPCSSAIVEWLMAHDVRPTIFYFNPNIFPAREYEIRKEESKRHAETLGLRWIDGDYDHASWREAMKGLEREPERGRRCEACFAYRMLATAHMAQQTGIGFFATTLASSRWKDLAQVNAAGLAAAEAVPGTTFWAQTGARTDCRNGAINCSRSISSTTSSTAAASLASPPPRPWSGRRSRRRRKNKGCILYLEQQEASYFYNTAS